MTSTVEIIIKTRDETTKSTKQAESNFKKLESTVKTLGAAFGIATGIIVGTGAAIKKSFDVAREGAGLDLLAQSARNLGVNVNLLQDSVKGTVSEFAIMNSMNTLLAGTSGTLKQMFLENSEQLLKISKAAHDVNPALGDTSFLFESIGRGIKRNSPLILDNLGLTIKVGEANQKYADSIGKTVEQLTAEEQKMALLNEVLRSGNILIEQAGGLDTEMVDNYEALASSWEDMANAAKEMAAVKMAGLFGNGSSNAGAVGGFFGLEHGFTQSWEAIFKVMKETDFSDLINALADGSTSAGDFADALAEIAAINSDEIFTKQSQAYLENNAAVIAYTYSLEELARMGREGIPITEEQTAATEDAAAATEEAAQAANNAAQAYNDLFSAANRDFNFPDLAKDMAFNAAGGSIFGEMEDDMKAFAVWISNQSPMVQQFFQKDIEENANQAQLAYLALQVHLGNIQPYEAARTAAKDLGMDYNEVLAMMQDDQLDFNKILSGTAGYLDTLRLIMEGLHGLTADMYVNIFTTGSIPNVGSSGNLTWTGPNQHQSNNGPQGGIIRQAAGGPLSAFSLVGEQGKELIINGVVIPAPLTARLLQLGLIPGQGYASGGPLLDGVLGTSPWVGTQIGAHASYSRSGGRGGGGRNLSHATAAAVQNEQMNYAAQGQQQFMNATAELANRMTTAANGTTEAVQNLKYELLTPDTYATGQVTANMKSGN